MNKRIVITLILLLPSVPVMGAERSALIDALKVELNRSFAALQFAAEIPLYYLSYQVTETEKHDISASYGGVISESIDHNRIFGIDCRVGDYELDNTHEIRGEFDFGMFGSQGVNLPVDNDDRAIRTVIWSATDKAYKAALERYTKVKTNEQVLVEKEDTSADFSAETANRYVGQLVSVSYDAEAWKARLRSLSAIFKEYPFVQTSGVELRLTNDNRFFVDSDGAEIQAGNSYARLFIRCSGTAEDGMRINRYESFDSYTPENLPGDDVLRDAVYRLIAELETLLKAPLAEPYTGPAILVNRASGVFFHEIFGHRIEGHRQKSETEGQTFARKIGERILPEFISIYDDPTLKRYNETFLRGHYLYDDEGVKTTRVAVVENGVLRNFLMSRSPINNFPNSNGHGRKQAGRSVVARQGNLIINSTNEHPFDSLLTMMLAECRRQEKPYGLVFYDISGGFTQTGRYGPQSFKVIPLLVYRYYTDGREPEAIRGVDIVGTPLSSFAKIVATGDDYDTFNGTCGAESGWVPVSATSPSILVSEVEIEKSMKGQEKPPILKPPYQPAKPKGTF